MKKVLTPIALSFSLFSSLSFGYGYNFDYDRYIENKIENRQMHTTLRNVAINLQKIEKLNQADFDTETKKFYSDLTRLENRIKWIDENKEKGLEEKREKIKEFFNDKRKVKVMRYLNNIYGKNINQSILFIKNIPSDLKQDKKIKKELVRFSKRILLYKEDFKGKTLNIESQCFPKNHNYIYFEYCSVIYTDIQKSSYNITEDIDKYLNKIYFRIMSKELKEKREAKLQELIYEYQEKLK